MKQEASIRPRDKDLSVVVQGPIHSSLESAGKRDVTIRCLKSIRTFLPGAEIVLSTWKGAPSAGLDYDVLVESDDPGNIAFSATQNPPGFSNLNRQIVSTNAGLNAASRPYAVKFRGDLGFVSDQILNYTTDLNAPLSGGLFRSRVLITPYLTYNPRHCLFLFLFSDIMQVGGTDDLRKLWSAPLAPEPETTRWLEGRRAQLRGPVRSLPYHVRVTAEQYLILSLLAQCGTHIPFDHPWDISPAKALLSERTLLENFRVLELDQLGVCFPERLTSTGTGLHYRNADWERLSRAYKRPLTRWRAQAGLLIKLYAHFSRLVLSQCLASSSIQAFPPYRWLRDLYRRVAQLRQIR